jgi:xanthine dehydrogenase YagS FAD-binding subunit
VRDRASLEFALVSVAVALRIDDGTVYKARLAAGGVGTMPWRLSAVEQALAGRPAAAASFREAAERAAEGAQPLAHNGFKLELLRRAVRRALEAIGGPA